MKYCIIKTTCSSKKEADFFAKTLIEKKLVACAQICKIESFYEWESEIKNDQEYEISLKTLAENYAKIELFILENHSYELAQIVAIPIENGSKNYLNWIWKNSKVIG